MKVDIAIQTACQTDSLPDTQSMQHWIETAIQHSEKAPGDSLEMTVRIVDEQEGSELNQQWRNKTGPTNVLSFPYLEDDVNEALSETLLGDIVICAPVVQKEAEEQDKKEDAHWAHLLIHGTLHLLGFDHIQTDDAEIMEGLERSILANLGYADPYAEEIA